MSLEVFLKQYDFAKGFEIATHGHGLCFTMSYDDKQSFAAVCTTQMAYALCIACVIQDLLG